MKSALSISLDELAVGFSIGLIDVPVAFTILLIALQAFIFTFLGLAFGSKFKRFLGEWSEEVVGIVLGLLGFWIIIEAVLKLYKQTKMILCRSKSRPYFHGRDGLSVTDQAGSVV